MSRRIRIGSASAHPHGEARQYQADGHTVAVVRLEDAFYAIGDTCSHQRISLSEGEVHPDTRELECWKHGSTFSLETGRPSCLPATRPVPVYAIEAIDDELWLEVP